MENRNKVTVWIRVIVLFLFATSIFYTGISSSDVSTWIFIFVIGSILLRFVKFSSKKNYNDNKNNRTHNIQLNNTCRHCGSYIDPNDTFCGHCGTSVEEAVICDYCGTKNSSEDLMCKNCNGLLK